MYVYHRERVRNTNIPLSPDINRKESDQSPNANLYTGKASRKFYTLPETTLH